MYKGWEGKCLSYLAELMLELNCILLRLSELLFNVRPEPAFAERDDDVLVADSGAGYASAPCT
jgi:hypothetical protein